MSIDFSKGRWDKVKADAAKWWAGELGRPLIQARLKGRDPGREKPSVPYYYYTSFYDSSVSAEEIIDAYEKMEQKKGNKTLTNT